MMSTIRNADSPSSIERDPLSEVDSFSASNAAHDARRHYVLPTGTHTRTPLYAHQLVGIVRLSTACTKRGYMGLLDQCGLGKTKQSILAAHELLQAGTVKKIIVVIKPDLASNWQAEFACETPQLRVQNLCGISSTARKTAQQRRVWDADADVYLINYELLALRPRKGQDSYMVRNAFSSRPLAINTDACRMKEMLKAFPCCLILDESQRIRTPDARTTQVICSLAPLARARMLLTATLMAESPLDVWSQLHYLDGGRLLGRSFRAFCAQHAIMSCVTFTLPDGRTFTKERATGFHHLDELHGRLASVTLCRTKAQCKDLPPKIHKTRDLVARGAQHALLCRLRDSLVEYVTAERGTNLLVIPGTPVAQGIQQLMRAAAMPCTVDPAVQDSEKLRALLEIADETTSQIVVWCLHRNVVEAVVQALRSKQMPVEFLYGGLNDKQRTAAVTAFMRGDARMLICNSAAQEGHNLQCASHAVYFQMSWSNLFITQSQDRIHRIGQTNTVVIETLRLQQGLDNYIHATLEGKARVVVQATSGGGDRVMLNKREFLDSLQSW